MRSKIKSTPSGKNTDADLILGSQINSPYIVAITFDQVPRHVRPSGQKCDVLVPARHHMVTNILMGLHVPSKVGKAVSAQSSARGRCLSGSNSADPTSSLGAYCLSG